jgi:type IV pilus assembly protein PilX
MKNKSNRGFVLVVCLILLVVMTMLGIFMFNGLTQDQKMGANFREKSRAVEAAQTGLTSVGYWLGQGNNAYLGPNNWVSGVACAANGPTPPTSPVVCNAALATPATLPWTSYSTYSPAGMSVAASGQNTYTSNTSVHTYFMGATSTNPPSALYQVTAAAKGGNDAATAVLRTVYKVQATSIDLGGG